MQGYPRRIRLYSVQNHIKEISMKVMVTGHRPNSLFGPEVSREDAYNLDSKAYVPIRNWFQKKFEELQPTELITGMALGIDQVFCQEAIKYKATHPDVRIIAAVPCREHSSKWREPSRKLYDDLLAKCDEVHLNDVSYTPAVMQIRNEYMVDRCDIVLGVWNGTPGGTYNCLKYASGKKKIHRLKVKKGA
jgi:uncharacterized phage-like protein YoqJ